MRIVSDNSDEEIGRHHAELRVTSDLIELSANLLRIIRGAGRAYEIRDQLIGVLQAMEEYRSVTGHGVPSDVISKALDFHEPEWVEKLGDLEWQRYMAKRQIIRGALQIAASELLGQRTQVAAGDTQLHEGIRELERVAEEQRKEFFSGGMKFSQRATRKAQPSKRKLKKT